ncbi:MAG: hypothetical protein WCA46_27140, partial [Actinocatenispora sp.]
PQPGQAEARAGRQRVPSDSDEPTGIQPAVPPRPSTGGQVAATQPSSTSRPDAQSVLAAVRDVPGVRAADLRTDSAGGRTVRLDVAEDADAEQITAAASDALRSRFGADTRLAVAAAGEFGADEETRDHSEIDKRPAGNGLSWPTDSDGARTGAPRAVIERIQVATAGAECAVEVCLAADGVRAVGRAGGPALDPFLLRVAAQATTDAVDVLAAGRARCAVEHVDVVTAGPCRVVVVVLVLMAGDSAERLVGSAVVTGDARQCTVRATMAALNRRLGPVLEDILA